MCRPELELRHAWHVSFALYISLTITNSYYSEDKQVLF